ncbi:hypothetical protein BJ138DRAFT_1116438 [Hygrophoropsis aurantiaca]|uniref:Uncharacterized protein n=1 Tax=Hygrophoropsis aurantiaca TaxID=72124 RepID=A0ACB8A3F3_9AGAM|nr:hypothetical protein BJ138DRAFT_1116438 [Hygrophoropsis aurantiaca]
MSTQSPQPSGSGKPMRKLRGSTPGLLDPSQSKRLLRFGGSLSFASFDPHTAHAVSDVPDIQILSIDEDLPPPKRIVIETTPNGTSFWRFVPKASLEEGVTDEGLWPRVVNICGERVICYQDQWEIYKLDPAYRCIVHLPPQVPSIIRVDPEITSSTTDAKNFVPKRMRTPPFEEASFHTHKRARSRRAGISGANASLSDSDSEDDLDEEEVKNMVVDDHHTRSKPKSFNNRQNLRRERNMRWQKNRHMQARYEKQAGISEVPSVVMADASTYIPPGSGEPTEDTAKRRGADITSPTEEIDPNRGRRPEARPNKRARTVSPNSLQNATNARQAARDQRRRAKIEIIDETHHNIQEQEFMNDIRQNSSEWQWSSTSTAFTPEGSQPKAPSEDSNHGDEGDAARQARLAESIRKMQELDKDKPLWEAQRQQREARERAEDQERAAKAEARRQAEAAQKRWAEEEAERERKRAQAEAERKRIEEEARQREQRQRKQRDRWGSGPWTTHRALERYKVLSEDFDNAKFGPAQPLAFHDIPWPVLTPPSRFTVEDVDWSAVEKFFETVRTHMRPQDYKVFVEKSHRRFHPDRWRARKVWSAVQDENDRAYLEVAANTVAQAITPLWREMKGN